MKSLWSKACVAARTVLGLLQRIIGHWHWTPPPWYNAIRCCCKDKPRLFFSTLVAIAILVSGIIYYQSLPSPITLTATIDPLTVTSPSPGAKPDNLIIHFDYDVSRLHDHQQPPPGKPSAARIDLLGSIISNGITLTPVLKGQWRWLNDRQLTFIPEQDWPAGVNYTVALDSNIFAPGTHLSSDSYTFTSPELSINFTDTAFYQDPADPSIRRVVSTVQFSHPVDKQSLQQHVSMTMRPSQADIEYSAKAYPFTIRYSNNLREAYLQSEALALPAKPNYMTITVDQGVSSVLGGQSSSKSVQAKQLIPDKHSFLKVESATTKIVRNEQHQPQQVMFLEFTDDIAQQELLSKLSLYVLPKKLKNNLNALNVDAALLAKSQKLTIDLVPNPRDHSKTFAFTFDAPQQRRLYLHIDEKLVSINEFTHALAFRKLLSAPRYPREVAIGGEGSILSFTGQHTLNLMSRGADALKVTVARVLDGQLNHLLTQTNGDISNPNFMHWSFNAKNLAKFHEQIVDIRSEHPAKANYSSLDLSTYLPTENSGFGLFFVEVSAWNKLQQRVYYNSQRAKRLVMITDLGVIVKKNANNTHDVFVQSIKTGEPVAGASVELLGKNGIAVYSLKTSAQGHASVPSTEGLRDEKLPTVFVVKSANDRSFIPFDRHSRQINLSKFDIGGVSSRHRHQNHSLNAYMFTDRGIYRPGENAKIAFIVKNNDLSNVQNIPLEIVISGPRGNELKSTRVILPKQGFFEYSFPTDHTADTGKYRVALHLIRDKKWRHWQIGNTHFNVEEFTPDTLKITSRLLEQKGKAWHSGNQLKATVSLNNLFGTAAQQRKVTARVIIEPARFAFDQYKHYRFTQFNEDKQQKPLHLDQLLPEQLTDADGLANFDIDLKQFRQGNYQLKLITEGFDSAGGRSVIATNSTLLSPLKELVAYKADGKLNYISRGSPRKLHFIAVDQALNSVHKSGLIVKQLDIQSLSTLVKQRNGTYQYQSIKREVEQSQRTLTIDKNGYELALDSARVGDFAIEIYDQQQRRLARVDYTVVGEANLTGKLQNNAELQLRLNKKDYLPGEQLEMQIKAPYTGAGLLTIETDSVKRFKWFRTTTHSTMQSMRIPEDIEGTAYVNVAFVRDAGSKQIFTSPLSYAVQPFTVDQSKRRVDIDLEVKPVVRPGKPMQIAYSTSKSSRLLVFAVDEGILQVANYQTPDPLGHFLKKRALDVKTLQILDLILPEFSLLRELSASGGGARAKRALAKNLNPFRRSVDKPAVFWSGIVDAGPDKQQLSFTIPNSFAGQLRVVAVAVSDESMGASETTTIARGPFVISPNLLTHATPGDEFWVTVGVANNIEGSAANAAVELTLSSSEHLQVVSEQRVRLTISEGSEAKHHFKVKTLDKLGNATLHFTATHNNEHTQRSASLSVRPAMTYYSDFAAGFTDSGTVTLSPARQLYPQLASQSVSASASALVLIDGLSSYLDSFPHGCTEQVVSKVFPIIGLASHPAFAPHLPHVRKRFAHVINKLRERQQSDGGFAFWPTHARSARYPSIYAMHFLIEANDLGYAVPTDMLEYGQSFLTRFVAEHSNNLDEARDRATAIYLLTRLGVVTTNYLVDLQENLRNHHSVQWKKDLLASYVAATYQLLQMDDRADTLIGGYQLGDKPNEEYDDFHSPLTQDAQHVYILAKHFPTLAKDLDGDQLLKLIDPVVSGNYNTIAAAYSILGLGAHSKLNLENSFDNNINFTATNQSDDSLQLEATANPFQKADYAVDTQSIRVTASEPLFYLNLQSGFDKQPPNKAVRNGLEIHRSFVDENGKTLEHFEQGQTITVRLRVRAIDNATVSNVAVVDLLPAGFEVVRSSVSRTAFHWRADYVDIREDRVIYYGDFGSTVRELTYKVKLTSAGDFIVPAAYAESMYDRSIRAMSKAGAIRVLADHEKD